MTFVLPLVALVLGVLLVFLDREKEPARPDWIRLAGLVLVAGFITVAVRPLIPEIDRAMTLAALWIGVAVVGVASFLPSRAFSISLGVAAAAAMHLLPATSQPAAQLALIVALGLGALVHGSSGFLTIAAVLVVAADALGAKNSDAAGAGLIGSEIGIAALVGILLAHWLPKSLALLRPVLIAATILASALIAGGRTGIEGALVCAGLGAAAGFILHWLLEDEDAESLRVGIAATIGLALATIAFGLGRGAGMAIALASAGLVLTGVGNIRALLALGPLLGLVLFRLLREAETGATRAFDIGQHYALVGLAAGMIVALLPNPRRSLAAPLWAVAMALVPYIGVVLLGAKGAIGLVVGLGFSGLVLALQTRRSVEPLALAAGLASATILLLSWMQNAADMARDDKIRLLGIAAGAIALLAVLLFLVDRQTAKESHS